MTAEELIKMPDDSYKYELVRGELIRMSPTGGQHGIVTINISLPLASYVKSHNLGKVCGAETGFKITQNPDTVRAPDVSFIARDRIPEEIPDNYWPFAPDLAVEVVSSNDRYDEIQQKVKEYLDAGARMVWVADPKTRIIMVYRSLKEVLVLTEKDNLSGEDVIPGFTCSVADLFAL
ncbi:MAG: Uma2 family endonuclease [Acidobacteria bacterium]|nr:Uma2 family endonuclease [Acidobacteriota bacterium]MBI3656089.1 Uma2 family endonuclease [Acidobacteriota bacterium]